MKKLFAVLLALAAALSLSACSFSITLERYTLPEETMPSETYSSDEVPGLEPGVYYYLMEETVEDLVTGVTTRTEYISGPEDGPARIGCVVYENDTEIRREDWEVDVRNNITKNTVTVDGQVVEVYEYRLTYNVNYDVLQRVCDLNGEWQYTQDYEYTVNGRLRFHYITLPGEDNPPWYEYVYDDVHLIRFDTTQARTPEEYKRVGQVIHSEEMIYDENDSLLRKVIHTKEGNGYTKTTEEYRYDEANMTVTILTYDDDDDLLRRTTRRYVSREEESSHN